MEQHPLAERAWRELYPEKRLRKRLEVRYSGKFKEYNANIMSRVGVILFSLARAYEEVSDEIKIGVMQYLLNKLYRTKIQTVEIDLYNNFIKKLTEYAEVTHVDPELQESFDRVNAIYFNNFMMTPNLRWGSYSLRKLGDYTFATDTITISTALREDQELLDYVMHHEMLHKKHKFDEVGTTIRSHTPAFKADERKYKLKNAEEKLEAFIRARKVPRTKRRRGLLTSLRKYFS